MWLYILFGLIIFKYLYTPDPKVGEIWTYMGKKYRILYNIGSGYVIFCSPYNDPLDTQMIQYDYHLFKLLAWPNK